MDDARDRDLLSTLLTRISLRGRVYSRPTGCGEWQINPTGKGQATYHLVSAGACWLHTRPGPPLQLGQGDLVFFPRDAWHVLSAHQALRDDRTHLPEPDGVIQARLVCGLYRANDLELQRILRGLPDVVLIRREEGDSRLALIVELLSSEPGECEPGCGILLDSLSDALLALILRHCLAHGSLSTGLLAALADPRLAPVLSALHEDPGADWNVSHLAQRAALSRSSLAERFQRVLGTSPGQYIADLRMQEACDVLRSEQASVAQIAERLGYATEAAFRRAFKRTLGLTPGDVRRGRLGGEVGAPPTRSAASATLTPR